MLPDEEEGGGSRAVEAEDVVYGVASIKNRVSVRHSCNPWVVQEIKDPKMLGYWTE